LQNVALLSQSVATAAEEKKSESSEQSSKYEKEQQKRAFLPSWLGLSTWMKVSSKLKV